MNTAFQVFVFEYAQICCAMHSCILFDSTSKSSRIHPKNTPQIVTKPCNVNIEFHIIPISLCLYYFCVDNDGHMFSVIYIAEVCKVQLLYSNPV